MATAYSAWPGLAENSAPEIIAEELILRLRHGHLEIVTPTATETVQETGNATLLLNRAFVRALRSGDWSDVRVPYRDALTTLAVVLAANRANETGKVVPVAEMLE